MNELNVPKKSVKFSTKPVFSIIELLFLTLILLIASCAHPNEKPTLDKKPVTFFIYVSNSFFTAANESDQALEDKFKELFNHTGKSGAGGQVGVGFVFPYLSWTEGRGAGPYKIPRKYQIDYENLTRVAAKLNVPVLVQFNGAVWHSPIHESAFLNYWKTVDGGKYLSRYQDGKVNSALSETGPIRKSKLKQHLDADPYGPFKENSLFFTLSPNAREFRTARINALNTAVKFWKGLDRKYPGVIQAFSTDSEVSTLSFREHHDSHLEIPIGFEKWNTERFCKSNAIANCKAFFERPEMDYKNPLDLQWFEFRSKNHLQFVQDTVDSIRTQFPDRPIFTHQISTLDGEQLNKSYKNQDLASPQWTAFAKGATPGFTVYTYAGDPYGTKRKFMDEAMIKTSGKAWGLLEFNTAQGFHGSKAELATFTKNFINYASQRGVTVIAPLSWESTSLDIGIKDSGVDEGIREFILEEH